MISPPMSEVCARVYIVIFEGDIPSVSFIGSMERLMEFFVVVVFVGYNWSRG